MWHNSESTFSYDECEYVCIYVCTQMQACLYVCGLTHVYIFTHTQIRKTQTHVYACLTYLIFFAHVPSRYTLKIQICLYMSRDCTRSYFKFLWTRPATIHASYACVEPEHVSFAMYEYTGNPDTKMTVRHLSSLCCAKISELLVFPQHPLCFPQSESIRSPTLFSPLLRVHLPSPRPPILSVPAKSILSLFFPMLRYSITFKWLKAKKIIAGWLFFLWGCVRVCVYWYLPRLSVWHALNGVASIAKSLHGRRAVTSLY